MTSVQELYRPVLGISELPEVPQQDTMSLSEYIDAKRFWDEQLRRCLYGWIAPDGRYINPKLYFYLNFVSIPVLDHNGNVLEKTNPYYLRDDQDTIDTIHFAESNRHKNAEDIIVAKARRKHWTFNTHCCVLLWDFVFDHNSNCGIGYPDEDYLDMGRLYFLEAYDSIPDYFKCEKIYPNNANEIGYASVRLGGKAVAHNLLYFYPIGKRPGKFRGKALKRLLIDEAGVYLNLLDCVNAGIDCVRLGAKKFGQILIGGTSDMITNKSTDYKDLYQRANDYGFKKIFIPAYKMMEGHIDYDTGISNTETALADLLQRRDNKRKSGSLKFYESEIQENPITEEECFIATGKSLFDVDQINKQAIVNGQNDREKDIITGYFEWIFDARGQNTGRVEFIEDAMGKVRLHLPSLPNKNNADLFVASIDDYYKDVSTWSDSKGCCIVYTEPSHKPVLSDAVAAVYLERPNTRTDFLNSCLKMCVFFGIGYGKLLLENNDNVAEKHYVDAGYGYMLRWVGKDIGIRLSEPIKNGAIKLGEEFIESGRLKNIYFNDVLDGIKKIRRGADKKALNTDIGSAMLLIWMLLDMYRNEYLSVLNDSNKPNQTHIAPQISFAFSKSDDVMVAPAVRRNLFTFSGR